MSDKTAAIIGVTGLVGSELLRQLVADGAYSTIRILVRRPYPKPHPSVEVKLVDFDDIESVKLALEETDCVFAAIGTTQSKVKSDTQLYRKIDFDIPLKVARLAKENGCEKFVVVSSVGASAKSGNFYLRLKGELEEALIKIGISSLHVFQPSVLLGERKDKRPAEKVLQGAMKLFGPLFFGSAKKYRAIHARQLAHAMIEASKNEGVGVRRYEYTEIVSFSGEQ